MRSAAAALAADEIGLGVEGLTEDEHLIELLLSDAIEVFVANAGRSDSESHRGHIDSKGRLRHLANRIRQGLDTTLPADAADRTMWDLLDWLTEKRLRGTASRRLRVTVRTAFNEVAQRRGACHRRLVDMLLGAREALNRGQAGAPTAQLVLVWPPAAGRKITGTRRGPKRASR